MNKIESSENPEKMVCDNAEPGKEEVAEKELKEVETRKDAKRRDREVETRKDAKRRDRAAKPKEEPEYFEETPILRELLDDNIYKYNWSFRNLEEAFENGDEKQEEDEIREEFEKHKGILVNKKVYLFWRLEPQCLSFQDKQQIVIIPVVVAVVLPFPPSDKLVIPLVQSELEDIIPMTKMDWVQYISIENRAGLKHLKEDWGNTSSYCLPYFYQPFKEEIFLEETEVLISYPDNETSTVCSFDWELEELEEFTDMLIEEDKLPSDKKAAFKEFVKEKVREAKKATREAKEARKKASEELNEETKTALQNMKFYKFYPVPTADTPDVSTVKSPFINMYYGKAHEIF